jgi:hypothetical protein
VWLAKEYGSFPSAWRTLQGIEAVQMIRKGRVRRVAKNDTVGQTRFIENLFGLAPQSISFYRAFLRSKPTLTKLRNKTYSDDTPFPCLPTGGCLPSCPSRS